MDFWSTHVVESLADMVDNEGLSSINERIE
jgi:hypothetical protein